MDVLEKADTWPKLLRQNAERYGTRGRAMRYKHYGIWQTYSWRDYLTNVKYLSLGLLSLGFQPGNRLLVVGDNSPEWYFAQLAAQCNRGVSVGLYSDLSAAEIEYIARDSQADFAVVEDEEQTDKLSTIRERLPGLKTVVYWRYKGLGKQNEASLTGLREVLRLGREYEEAHPAAFEENVATGKADDICSVVYSSGATGDPKGALHTYGSLMADSRRFSELNQLTAKDELVSYLPPAWITEQWLLSGCHLLSGGTVDFAESAQTHREDMREIGPTLVVYNSRLWESIAGEVRARMRGASLVKRTASRLLFPVGNKVADARLAGRKPAPYWLALNWLADLVVFRPIRDLLGLPHARICYSSGSSLAPETIRFFNALKVPLRTVYGSTEAGAIAGAAREFQRAGTAGKLNPGVELCVSDDGEILVRHSGTFVGYCGLAPADQSGANEGWVATGDRGYLTPDGDLVFVDRMASMTALPSGDIISPQEIESRLRYSPYIRDAWLLAGSDRPHVSVVIIVDAANTGRWADKAKVAYTTFADLSQKPEVYDLIAREIAAVNEGLPEAQRIHSFVNLHKEFDPDEVELTRNRKLRRQVLAERYDTLVDALKGDGSEVEVEAQFTYQDGRIGRIKTALHIARVGAGDR
jgi:long-chain acyl-CoA synthetase